MTSKNCSIPSIFMFHSFLSGIFVLSNISSEFFWWAKEDFNAAKRFVIRYTLPYSAACIYIHITQAWYVVRPGMLILCVCVANQLNLDTTPTVVDANELFAVELLLLTEFSRCICVWLLCVFFFCLFFPQCCFFLLFNWLSISIRAYMCLKNMYERRAWMYFSVVLGVVTLVKSSEW